MTEPEQTEQPTITSSLEFGADVYNALRGDFPLVGRDEPKTAELGYEIIAMIRRMVHARMPRQKFLAIVNLLYCEQAMVEANGNMCTAAKLISDHRNTIGRILGWKKCPKIKLQKRRRSSR